MSEIVWEDPPDMKHRGKSERRKALDANPGRWLLWRVVDGQVRGTTGLPREDYEVAKRWVEEDGKPVTKFYARRRADSGFATIAFLVFTTLATLGIWGAVTSHGFAQALTIGLLCGALAATVYGVVEDWRDKSKSRRPSSLDAAIELAIGQAQEAHVGPLCRGVYDWAEDA